MAERGKERTARGRAATWPEAQSGPRVAGGRGAPWQHPADLFAAIAAYFKEAAAVDFGPGRVVPWLPVAFGLGVAVYFTAEHEPSWIAAVAAALFFSAMVYPARHRAVAFPLTLVLAAFAVGFAVITIRTAVIAHPVLDRAVFGASVIGFVEAREEREKSDRITIRVERLDGTRMARPPERVRLSVKRGTAPAVGSFVSLKARLNPPLAPLRPGGYDFARDLYFQRIGAVGFVTGAIKIETPPQSQGFRLSYAAFIDGIRESIDKRIRASVPGDGGSIASALITGKRDAITKPVNDAMYISSLAHVLSISGYHMALVAGVVFFVVRAGLALIPGFSSRHPTKKWGAGVALVAATLYLALSGAEVATQRSYVMTAVVLAGVMADRATLTLRTLAVAAFAVLLLTPESVAHPSFQMSFAATLALVAAYQGGLPWASGGGDTSLGARIALWGGREVAALLFASVVAGFATTPYAAFHFHRIAPYGVIANLLAMPVVSVVVMPAGLVALIAMPFGLDGPLWRLMGLGIDWMIAVVLWVANLPGAVGRVTAFGVGALIVITAGMIVLCLMRTRLRYAGVAIIVAGCALALNAKRPDVLVSSGGDAIAVRTASGTLSVLRLGGSAFTVNDWLGGDADTRTSIDKTLVDGFTCDEAGCIARLADNTIVAVSRTAAAIAEDCRAASLVVTSRDGPLDCQARMIDRKLLRAQGALDLRRAGESWQVEAAMPAGTDRPWARGSAVAEARATTSSSVKRNAAPRDATPKAEDLEADD